MNLQEINNKVNEYLIEHETEFLEDLSGLIAIESVRDTETQDAPYGKECARALEYMISLSQKYGFETHNFENHAATCIYRGKNDTVLLDVLSHLDVVAAGEGWSTNPFTLHRNGEYIYGRGVADDKGPSLTSLYALRALKELGIVPENSIRLIFGSAEETGFDDLKYYFKTQKSAPNTFSPDACFPIYNGEKGRYAPDFSIETDNKSAQRKVISFECGNAPNIVPERARCVISGVGIDEIQKNAKELESTLCVKFDLEEKADGIHILCSGRSAHAALPKTGINSLTALIRLIVTLKLDECESLSVFKNLDALFPHNDTNGTAIGINMAEEISGEITVTFSMLHFDGSKMLCVCDMRLPFCATEENVKDVFVEKLTCAGFKVSGEMIKPHYVDKDGDFVKALGKCYELVTQNKAETLVMGGSTYVHDIEGGVAFGAVTDFTDLNEHGANERVKLSDLMIAARVFAISYIETTK